MNYKLVMFDSKTYNVAIYRDDDLYIAKPPYSTFKRSNVVLSKTTCIYKTKSFKKLKEKLINLSIYNLLNQLYELSIKSNEGSPIFQDTAEISSKIFNKINTLSFLFYENKAAIVDLITIGSLAGIFSKAQSERIFEIFDGDKIIVNALNNRCFSISDKLISYVKDNISPYINKEGKWMEAKNAYFIMYFYSKELSTKNVNFFHHEYKEAVKNYEGITGRDVGHSSIKRQANSFSSNANYRDWQRKRKKLTSKGA
jgi:hypothetical protein